MATTINVTGFTPAQKAAVAAAAALAPAATRATIVDNGGSSGGGGGGSSAPAPTLDTPIGVGGKIDTKTGHIISGPMAGQQAGTDTAKPGGGTTYTPAPAAPPTPAPPAPTPVYVPPASSTTGAPPAVGAGAGAGTGAATPSVGAPTVSLAPGSTDTAAVKQLQDYLVSKGLMTESQKNTGYGVYGQKTTAAVLALQKQLGIDYSTGPGFYGPKTIDAVQKGTEGATATTNPSGVTTNPDPTTPSTPTSPDDPTAQMNPVERQVYLYQQFSTQLGLPTIKEQLDKTLADQKALADELQGKIDGVNNNPWLSEGIRVKEVTKLQDSYKVRLDTLSNFEKLYDSMYKSGQAQVEHMVSGAEADIAALNKIANDQLTAATALAKDNIVQSVGGRELLVSRVTGKVVADLGPSDSGQPASVKEYEYAKTQGYKGTYTQYQNEDANRKARAAGSGTKTTAAERADGAVASLQTLLSTGQPLADGTKVVDANGYITPVAWKRLIQQAPSEGLTRAQFITSFGNQIYVDPKSGNIPSTYGLTPLEQKTITGALPV